MDHSLYKSCIFIALRVKCESTSKQFSALVYEPFPVLWFFSPLCGLLCAELKGGQFFNEVSGADQENSKKEPNSLRNINVHPEATAHPLFSTFATHCHSSFFFNYMWMKRASYQWDSGYRCRYIQLLLIKVSYPILTLTPNVFAYRLPIC